MAIFNEPLWQRILTHELAHFGAAAIVSTVLSTAIPQVPTIMLIAVIATVKELIEAHRYHEPLWESLLDILWWLSGAVFGAT